MEAYDKITEDTMYVIVAMVEKTKIGKAWQISLNDLLDKLAITARRAFIESSLAIGKYTALKQELVDSQKEVEKCNNEIGALGQQVLSLKEGVRGSRVSADQTPSCTIALEPLLKELATDMRSLKQIFGKKEEKAVTKQVQPAQKTFAEVAKMAKEPSKAVVKVRAAKAALKTPKLSKVKRPTKAAATTAGPKLDAKVEAKLRRKSPGETYIVKAGATSATEARAQLWSQIKSRVHTPKLLSVRTLPRGDMVVKPTDDATRAALSDIMGVNKAEAWWPKIEIFGVESHVNAVEMAELISKQNPELGIKELEDGF